MRVWHRLGLAVVVTASVFLLTSPARFGTRAGVSSSVTCQNLLVNGDFEQGAGVGWQEFSLNGQALVTTDRPRTGAWGGRLGGYTDTFDYLYQVVTVPQAYTLTLTLWFQVEGTETLRGDDTLAVDVYDETGQYLQRNLVFEDTVGLPQTTWISRTVTTASLSGTLWLQITAVGDENEPTTFYLDDVQLVACPGQTTATPTPTPTVSPTFSPTPTLTPSSTPTATPSPSPTPTLTPTPTPTATATRTASPTSTASPTTTPSPTPTFTLTPSPTRSPTPTSTPTHIPSITPTPGATPTPECRYLVRNGDFEQGREMRPWLVSSQAELDTLATTTRAHSGAWSAWLGGYNLALDIIWQRLRLPEGVPIQRFRFWYFTQTPEGTSPGLDTLTVTLRNLDGVGSQTVFLGASPTAGWKEAEISPTGLSGRVEVSFSASTDAQVPTSWWVDDVVWEVCGGVYRQYVPLVLQ